jgi:uncharacterized protein (TIGR00369 family)
MIRIRNPYTSREGYNCFGCSPANPQGLRMDFIKEGDKVISYWQPTEPFQGWNNVLHGGIQATLIDEIGNWFASLKADTSGVTTNLNIKYRKAVFMDQGPVKLEASFQEMHGRIMVVSVNLYSSAGVLCTEAKASYYMVDVKTARDQFMYPGLDAFMEG